MAVDGFSLVLSRSPGGHRFHHTESLFLHSLKTFLLIDALGFFFRAVGRAKHGEPYKMNWDGLEGARLRVHVGQRSYTDKFGEEHTVNEVDKFIDYYEGNFPDDPGWLLDAMTAEEGLPF